MTIGLFATWMVLALIAGVVLARAATDGKAFDDACEDWLAKPQLRITYTGGRHVRPARVIPFQRRRALAGTQGRSDAIAVCPSGGPLHAGVGHDVA